MRVMRKFSTSRKGAVSEEDCQAILFVCVQRQALSADTARAGTANGLGPLTKCTEAAVLSPAFGEVLFYPKRTRHRLRVLYSNHIIGSSTIGLLISLN